MARMSLRKELVLLVVTIALLPVVTRSLTLSTEILVFGIAVAGANLLLGRAGLLSFGQAVFFGFGGYLGGALLKGLPLGLLGALVVSALAGAVLAAVLGMVAIRKRGIYFVMLTLAFCQLAYFISYTASGFTGGENGLLDVPRAVLPYDLMGSVLRSPLGFFLTVAALFLLVATLIARLESSPFGSVLAAIRSNEMRASVIGYDVKFYKVCVFAVSGAVTAVAGTMHASLLGFVPLTNVSIEMSEKLIIMTILAGTGGVWAALVSAAAFMLLNDWFAALWPRWMMLLGITLIVVAWADAGRRDRLAGHVRRLFLRPGTH
jgi:branched-chain amino acid transport system permease protein